MRWLGIALVAAALASPATADGARQVDIGVIQCLRPGPGAKIVDGPAPATVSKRFGVFRRPATSTDRAPRGIVRGPFYRVVMPDAARRVGDSSSGHVTYLMPAKLRYLTADGDCLRRFPPRERRSVIEDNRRLRRESARWGIALIEGEVGEGFGLFGAGFVPLRAAVSGTTFGTSEQGGPTSLVTGLVPDGIATVTLLYHGGFGATVAVADNYWSAHVPLDAERSNPRTLILRGPDGRVVRTIRAG